MKRFALAALLLASPAAAQTQTSPAAPAPTSPAAPAPTSPAAPAPTITADHAWARATSPSQTVGGVFLTLNATGAADRLVSVTSPAARMVELHETVKDGDVMRMRPVDALPIEPGHATELKPGGYHLMMMGLAHPLAMGTSFPITLTFEKAPPVTTTVMVEAAGASGMSHMHMP